MEIRRVSIVGMGALGVLYGEILSRYLQEGSLRFVADEARIERYRREGVYCNGEACRFSYLTPEETGNPADLLIFAVKFGDLEAAVRAAANQAGPGTVIISLLNGIVSEEVIGRALGAEKVIPAVAQGMDAVKEGNRLTYSRKGVIVFGDRPGGGAAGQVEAVRRLFEAAGVPHQVASDMRRVLWNKFMLNVGVNQAAAVFGCGYGGLQAEGAARDAMIAAMREALALARLEGVGLNEGDIEDWMKLIGTLSPEGKPSMLQDIEARRHSEVGLFAGTVLALSEKHGIISPVNRMLYEKIMEIERDF